MQAHLWLMLTVALVVSVVTDLMSRRILDVVTLPTVALALGLRAYHQGLGDTETGVLSGLIGLAGATVLFAVLALRGKGFGWGDVKLMAAVGAVFGYPLVMGALIFISLAGALQAVVSLLWQGTAWDTVSKMFGRLAARLQFKTTAGVSGPGRHIPYGVAIALGSFWAMWWDHSNLNVQG